MVSVELLKSIAVKAKEAVQFVRETGYVVIRDTSPFSDSSYGLPGGQKNKIYYAPELDLVELLVDIEILCDKILSTPVEYFDDDLLHEFSVEMSRLLRTLERMTGVEVIVYRNR